MAVVLRETAVTRQQFIEGAERAAVTLLTSGRGVTQVGIFGSLALGNENPGDLDLLVVTVDVPQAFWFLDRRGPGPTNDSSGDEPQKFIRPPQRRREPVPTPPSSDPATRSQKTGLLCTALEIPSTSLLASLGPAIIHRLDPLLLPLGWEDQIEALNGRYQLVNRPRYEPLTFLEVVQRQLIPFNSSTGHFD